MKQKRFLFTLLGVLLMTGTLWAQNPLFSRAANSPARGGGGGG